MKRTRRSILATASAISALAIGASGTASATEDCDDLLEWEPDTVYGGDDRVVHQDTVWEAQWGTQGDEPGANDWGPWQETAPCEDEDDDESDDGGDDGDEDDDVPSAGDLPEHFFAPYVDVTLDGHDELIEYVEPAGTRYFTVAFVLAGDDGEPAWAGDVPVGESVGWIDVEGQISDLREQEDGEVVVSFGGLDGTYLAEATDDATELRDHYEAVIEATDASFIDFDEEQHIRDGRAVIERRNDALALLQADYPDVEISYTLPALPEGLPTHDDNDVLFVLEDAAEKGVEIDVVNPMTMNYGADFELNGETVFECAENVQNQLGELWPEKSDAERWNMIGITPMIGQNDVEENVFSQEDAQYVLEQATDTGVRWLSFWELIRDDGEGSALFESSQIEQEPFEFSTIFGGIDDQ
ncbi:lysozyme [Natrarchaeobius oligotrophus]|uniref:Lysozyme n=1 Tax=Natrarchaeobius chitinivorans TaxID=1679083 RepID=A0A3N6PG64_NATCH|nr:lysozyme [Natrarchaeobius chitinivorans]RQG99209.1 lysozyme [Natrarchaeobius chitinivorans]